MYSIDGVALQNPSLGWRFKRASEPRVARGIDQADFNASNRDGSIVVRGHVTTPTFTVVVTTPTANYDTLRQLLRLGTSVSLTATPGVVLNVQAQTVTPQTITVAGAGLIQVTAVYRVAPDVWWRDAATTDWAATLATTSSAGSATMTILTATTGSVHDALVLIEGHLDTPRVAGANGTWVQVTGGVWGWARIDCTRGRAWAGGPNDGLNHWTDTSLEYTSYLNSGAYPYFLEAAPTSTGTGCPLVVSWNSVTESTTVTVRAKNAYDR